MTEHLFLLVLSTILVVIVTALLAFLSAVLWQLVKILREIRGVARDIHAGSDALFEDFLQARAHVKRAVKAVTQSVAARAGKKADSGSKKNA